MCIRDRHNNTLRKNQEALQPVSYTHLYMKCVDVCPQPEPDILLAVGQANGKVVLTTFGQTAFDSLGLAGLELGMCIY